MSHLKIEELLDLAEGARAEATAPHLVSCAYCREQLADLQAAMAAVAPGGNEIPEPSPLFWEHFSARVREAVVVETASKPGMMDWAAGWLSWKVSAPVTAVAFLLLVTLSVRNAHAPAVSSETAALVTVAEAPADTAASSTDDPSWALVTDLAADMDWDAVVEAGLAAPTGSVDRAVFDLSADERRELQRLLKEELARSGSSGV